jgi:hypothetical protein
LSEGLMTFREFFQPLINGHLGSNVARVRSRPGRYFTASFSRCRRFLLTFAIEMISYR